LVRVRVRIVSYALSYEKVPTSETFIEVAMIRLMLKRLAR